PLGKAAVECDASVQFNSLEQAEEMRLSVKGLSPEQIASLTQGPMTVQKAFGNSEVTGTMANGTGFEVSVVFIKGVEFGSEAEGVQLRCYLSNYRQKPVGAMADRRTWSF